MYSIINYILHIGTQSDVMIYKYTVGQWNQAS